MNLVIGGSSRFGKELEKFWPAKYLSSKELTDVLKLIQVSRTHTHTEFFGKIKKIDQVRNTYFVDICPEWAQLLG